MGCSSSKNEIAANIIDAPSPKSPELPPNKTPPQSPVISETPNPTDAKEDSGKMIEKNLEAVEDSSNPEMQPEDTLSNVQIHTNDVSFVTSDPSSSTTCLGPSLTTSEVSVVIDDKPKSNAKRKAPTKKTTRGFIDFQSFLELDSMKELMRDFPYLLDDQVLEVFEVLDEDDDGLVTSKQAEDIVFAVRGREQSRIVQEEKVSPSSPPATSTSNKKILKPLVHTPEPTSPKKTLIRSNSSMAIEKGIILNDFVAENVAPTAPISPPPQVKRGFLITSSGNSPLSSPSRPSSSNPQNQRMSSLGTRSRFHVLDQGILYHLDSNVTSGPVALDKHGVSLRGHTVVTSEPDSNLIILSTKALTDQEEDEMITLEIKNEQDRLDWIKAINEHIAYISEQEYFVRKQLAN